MKIITAEFFTSAEKPSQYPQDDLPHIALVGKSNVGKSSLINALTNNKKLARVSSSPGKTRLVNFFLVNQNFYIVDLPGYGFAKVSKSEKEKWGTMIDQYFSTAKQLQLLIMLVDIRHDPTREDKQMAEWIRYYKIPVILALTKSDKLGKTRIKPRAAQIKKELGFSGDIMHIPCSSVTGYGLDEIQDSLDHYIALKQTDII
ncbi:MAG: ribosome biogenesis GTP-binding protein YihA/YsxC [Eubacteriales bacterium]|nr:ribosome biogenesis GTP-binding protein YihA/YsxC [Clostridia bacterium]MDI9512943.1 ribosome biogenesis GTP-binding protein YihA/YsxC [Bacillota bacterium]